MATCTAPGHPDCKITCKNGCYASYVEPDGPCDTGCSNSLKKVELSESQKVSVSVDDLSVDEVLQVFGSIALGKDVNRKKRISFSLKAASLAGLSQEIRKHAKD